MYWVESIRSLSPIWDFLTYNNYAKRRIVQCPKHIYLRTQLLSNHLFPFTFLKLMIQLTGEII